MIKAIFWDNDGVLVDTEHLYLRATQQVLSTVGVALTRELYIELFLVQATGAWHLAAAKGVPADAINELKQQRDALYSDLLRTEARVIDGVHDVVKELSRHYLMGIVTSSHRHHFDLIHSRTGLLPYFQFVLASGDYARCKPAPDPYLEAIARSGFRADECLVIEDSERGLAAATAAGLSCIIVPSTLTRGCGFAGAYKVLDTIEEVYGLITLTTK